MPSEARPIGMSLADPEGDGFVQSVARGLAVIRAFGPGHERLTMAQVASAALLTRAGARRILLTLHNLGYVAIDGRYFCLTSRVLDLGRGYLAQSLWEVTRPELEKVADVLNETASAGVLDGFDVVYTVRVRSRRILQLELSPGSHLPAHGSSMGQVLLAALPSVELAGYLRQATFEAYTASTISSRDELCGRLEQIRAQGWALSRGEIDESNSGVSVPLVDREGKTLAALNVSIHSDRATPEMVEARIVPMLKQAAASIAAKL